MSLNSTCVTVSPKRTTVQPASILLNKFVLIIAVVLLILAAWGGHMAVVVLLGLGLAAAGVSLLWSHFSLSGVSCERKLSEQRIFPGEELELKLRLVNRKLIPLPWVQVSDEVPTGFLVNTPPLSGTRPGFSLLSKNASILWYSATTWKYRLQCTHRGYYPLGPLTITSGDIFGFYPRTVAGDGTDNIIVYPRMFALTPPVIPSLFPLGETNSDRRIFEDPSRTIGIRDYSPGDSLRRIHWKASVRQGQLQVKIFEPSTTLKVEIFLAIESYQHNGLWSLDEMELGISTAASLANHLLEKKSQVGFFCNSRLADSGQPARLHAATGTDQLLQILEGLAKVVPITSRPFPDFFQEERRNLSLGTTLIFLFSEVPDTMKGIFIDLEERGYRIVVLQTGKPQTGTGLPEVAYYQVSYSAEKGGINLQVI